MSVRRSLQIAVLAIAGLLAVLLASPGTASALTRTHTSVGVNHSTIRLGSSVAVHGTVSPKQAGHVVKLQQKSGGRWKTVRSQHLAARSTYRFSVRPSHTGVKHYRVVDPATRTRAASTSRVVTVTVKPRPSGSGSGCTAGYSPCLPPASDYDCAGGSGNGPAYANGPIHVTGSDPYDLDRDGDGVACED